MGRACARKLSDMSDLPWFVYLILSDSSGRVYTGITTDAQRRLDEHNGKGRKGAKATRAGRPWRIVHLERYEAKGDALRRELAIKRLRREAKLRLAGLS